MILMAYSRLMLLTGAGFTKNVGGYLGSELWAKIYNFPSVQDSDTLRRLLQSDMDFEWIYHFVMINKKGIEQSDKDAIHEALLNAYANMNELVLNHVKGAVIGFSVYEVSNWLKELFCTDESVKSLWFTLNQDLFFERWFRGWRIVCPGATPFSLDSYPRGSDSPDGKAEHLGDSFGKDDFVTIKQDVKIEDILSDIESGPSAAYIKLHGSYGWKSSNGQETMVIGQEKEKAIENESLLLCYKQVFTDAIKEGDKRLLVIGYGFADGYINAIITEGIERYGLRLYILRPSSPKHFKESVLGEDNSKIWGGVYGYFQYYLRDVLGKNVPGAKEEISLAMLSGL